GGYHTLAIKTDGSLWAWGNNGYGQLGDGSNIVKYNPTIIPCPESSGLRNNTSNLLSSVTSMFKVKFYEADDITLACDTMLSLDCGIDTVSTCISIIDSRAECDWATNTYHVTVNVDNISSPGFNAGQILVQSSDGNIASITPSVINLSPPLSPSDPPRAISFDVVTSPFPDPDGQINLYFQLIDVDGNVYCNQTVQTTVTANCCNPCDELSIHVEPSRDPKDSCCYNIDISNLCADGYFDKVELCSQDPSVVFGSQTLNQAWNYCNSTTATTTCFEHNSGHIPVGTHADVLKFCVDTQTNYIDTICWRKVVGGEKHTLAIDNLGRLWGWGGNQEGQLGNSIALNYPYPILIDGSTNWKDITAGAQHSIALKDNGTLWACGQNNYGQLGISPFGNVTALTDISNGQVWKAVSTGDRHTIGLDVNGKLFAWGDDDSEQLGNGPGINSSSTPSQIGTDTWTSIEAGIVHNLAIRDDGTLWGWGENDGGQVGDLTFIDKDVPTQILSTYNDFTKISAGYVSFALRSNNELWGWGANSYGQLGNNTSVWTNTPSIIPNPASPNSIIDFYTGRLHSILLDNAGNVYGTGYNLTNQLCVNNPLLGPYNDITLTWIPTGITGATQIFQGYDHNFAMTTGNQLIGWGFNHHGNLNIGTLTYSECNQNVSCLVENNPSPTTQPPYSFKLKFYHDGAVACDKMFEVDCIPDTLNACLDVSNITTECLYEQNKYKLTFTVSNVSNPAFTASSVIVSSLNPNISFSPSTIDFNPDINSGQSQSVMTCIMTSPFPYSSSVALLQFQLVSADGRTICTEAEQHRVLLDECPKPCGFTCCEDGTPEDFESKPLGPLTTFQNGYVKSQGTVDVVQGGCDQSAKSILLNGGAKGLQPGIVSLVRGGVIGPIDFVKKDSMYCIKLCAYVPSFKTSPYDAKIGISVGNIPFHVPVGEITIPLNTVGWYEYTVQFTSPITTNIVNFTNNSPAPVDAPTSVQLDNICFGSSRPVFDDPLPPVLNCPSDLTITDTDQDCIVPYIIPSISITDNYGIASTFVYLDGTITSIGTSHNLSNSLVHEIKYVAEDLCGNRDSCLFALIINCLDPCGQFCSKPIVYQDFQNFAFNTSNFYDISVIQPAFLSNSGCSSTKSLLLQSGLQPPVSPMTIPPSEIKYQELVNGVPNLLLKKDTTYCFMTCMKPSQGYSIAKLQTTFGDITLNNSEWTTYQIFYKPSNDIYFLNFRNSPAYINNGRGPNIFIDNITWSKVHFVYNDHTPPDIDCPNDITVSGLASDCSYVLAIPSIPITDNSGLASVNVELDGIAVQIGNSYTLIGPDDFKVEYTAVDLCGNESVCSYEISVNCDSSSCSCKSILNTHFYNSEFDIDVICNQRAQITIPCSESASSFGFGGQLGCSDTCKSKVEFTIKDNSTGAVVMTGSQPVSGMNFNITGLPYSSFVIGELYIFTLKGFCGTDSCICTIPFKIVCDTCCKSPKEFEQLIISSITATQDPQNCKLKINFEDLANCNVQIQKINWGGGAIDQGPFYPGSMIMHSYPNNLNVGYLVIIDFVEYDENGKLCNSYQMRIPLNLNCEQCCRDFKKFKSLINQGFQMTMNGCEVSVSLPQFGNCHYIDPSPSWGDGTPTSSGPFTAPFAWTHTYNNSGTYTICVDVYEHQNGNLNDVCWYRQICKTVTVTCLDTCTCAGFQNLSFQYDKNQSIKLQCNDTVRLVCPPQGCSWNFFGDLLCKGNCPVQSVDWQLINLTTNGTVYSGSSQAFPAFGVYIPTPIVISGGNYMLKLLGHCGQSVCECKVYIKMPGCNRQCPCIQDELIADVDAGISVVSDDKNCQVCFKPNKLKSCDEVKWFKLSSPNNVFATSISDQLVCTNFPNPGIHRIKMAVTRYDDDGNFCEEYERIFSLDVKCTGIAGQINCSIEQNEFDYLQQGEIVLINEFLLNRSNGLSAQIIGNQNLAVNAIYKSDICFTEEDLLKIIDISIQWNSLNYFGSKLKLYLAPSDQIDYQKNWIEIGSYLRNQNDFQRLSVQLYPVRKWISYCESGGSYKLIVTVNNELLSEGSNYLSTAQIDELCIADLKLEKNVAWDFIVKPNPTKDEFTIFLPLTGDDNFTFELYNQLGEQLSQQSSLIGAKSFNFGQELVPGIYFVKLMNGDRSKVHKLIKQ
ncbi:MAG TPA: T9SS type A sorting domain-containing protein, partial [Saprospiraceae bacterium]|nr:T9SS type A sorting domain-containing protein [Saprospiraceae bacterium]